MRTPWLAVPCLLTACATPTHGAPVATYLIAVADDFVVDVWHNGVCVPEARRSLLWERFGACTERIDVPVRAGDWLVFHVVNNRLRWGGARYFAVAGCVAPNEIAFASDPDSPRWSVCDDPAVAARFVAERDAGVERRPLTIANPWAEGDGAMRASAGASFAGRPLWGGAASTWVKVRIE
jgi:hypothetical protein